MDTESNTESNTKSASDLDNKINRYLAKVAEQDPLALPEALFRASMLRTMLSLLGMFMGDFDDCLKQLENQYTSKKGKTNE